VIKRKRLIALAIIVILVVLNFINPFKVQRPSIQLAAEQVFEIAGVPISNAMVASWLTTLVLVAISLLATRKMKLAPEGRSLQNAVEAIIEALYRYMERMAGNHARVFFPLAATLFLFIITSNWMGLLPGYGSFGLVRGDEGYRTIVPLLRSANTDLNTTLALAICSVLGTQLYGIRVLGLSAYLSRFVNITRFTQFFAGLIRGGPRKPIGYLLRGGLDLFIGLLEIFEELTKILSFSFRLFGNIFAGEVLLVVVAFLVPYAASLPFMGLELFIGFIQALIFMVLTVAFTMRAITPHVESATEKSERLLNNESPMVS